VGSTSARGPRREHVQAERDVQRLTATLVMKVVVPERAAKIGAAPRGR
jgi:hypothetical protein